ncbi:MAG: sugar phosphate isomerase/epimerase [Planctomycetota bacterium]|nr:MAG: sugar phosphate isomerase/epimerase [Planctomycetota bacterium]
MNHRLHRRSFLQHTTAAGLGLASLAGASARGDEKAPLFKISLAQWSLHKTLFSGRMNNLDFAKAAKMEYGIDAVEYVNQFFATKAQDMKYLAEMKSRANDVGVTNVLIMIDGEGQIGDPSEAKRLKAVENHYKWVEAAKFLGCHSIRVNAYSKGSPEEQAKLVTDGLIRLAEFAKDRDINIIVENHGGLSSNGMWLAGVMKMVDMENVGTLPDFGNFDTYDRYKGVKELMPYAKGVSAKSMNFDEAGDDVRTDFRRMIKIVLDAGYHGYVGIEYEGSELSEPAGIIATRKLLEKVRQEFS